MSLFNWKFATENSTSSQIAISISMSAQQKQPRQELNWRVDYMVQIPLLPPFPQRTKQTNEERQNATALCKTSKHSGFGGQARSWPSS